MASIHIHAPLCFVAGALFPPVCSVLVVLRFMGRTSNEQRLGLDDWLTIPPLLLLIGMCIAVLYGAAKHAVGYPSPPLAPGETIFTAQFEAQTILKNVLWAVELMQVPALGCIKCSLLLFYRRVFQAGTARVLRIAMLATLVVTVVWTIAFWFSFFLICYRRFDAYWTTLANEKKYCLNDVMIHNSYAISDVILDILIILLPIPMVLRLQMTWKRKLAVLGLFLLGTASIVASVIRMVTFLESTKVLFKPGTDELLLTTGGIYWSVVECGLALMCCCLLTVRKAFRQGALQRLLRLSGWGSSGSKDTLRRASLESRRTLEQSLGDEVELQDLNHKQSGSLDPSSISHKSEIVNDARTMEGLQLAEDGHGIAITRTYGVRTEAA